LIFSLYPVHVFEELSVGDRSSFVVEVESPSGGERLNLVPFFLWRCRPPLSLIALERHPLSPHYSFFPLLGYGYGGFEEVAPPLSLPFLASLERIDSACHEGLSLFSS